MQPSDLVADIWRILDGPAWRVAVAAGQALGEHSRVGRRQDALVSRVADFIGLRNRGDSGKSIADRKHCDIADAFRLWAGESTAERLMILAVADCGASDIAEYLGVTEATVTLTESLFFDVRTCLRAPSWIAARVIEPQIAAGKAEFTAGLKLAYYGGAIVAESLLDARARMPLKEADRLFDRDMLLHVKMLGVLSAPLGSPEDAADFLKLALDYETRKTELQLEREKFEHQRAQDIRTHDLEMQRLRAIEKEYDRPSASRTRTSIEKPVDAASPLPVKTHEPAA